MVRIRGIAEGVEIRLGSQRITFTGTEDPAEIRRMADLLKAAYPKRTCEAEQSDPSPLGHLLAKLGSAGRRAHEHGQIAKLPA